jgi:hypothetical protein
MAKGIDRFDKGFWEFILPDITPFAWLGSAYQLTGAVIDQVPQSAALRKIGPTPIPSHAMTTYINTVEAIKNDPADIDQIYYKRMFGVGMLLYFYESITNQLLSNLALEWDRLPQQLKEPKDRYYRHYTTQFLDKAVDDLELFKDLYKAPLEQNYILFNSVSKDFLNSTLPIYESSTRTILQYESAESSINDFDNDEHSNFIDRRADLFKDSYEVSASGSSLELTEELINKYRFLLFKNDWNDGTVRFDSQTGSLDATGTAVSIFTNHLHSYAPRYPDVISRVVTLLKSGLTQFDKNGFPNAGRKLPIWLPDMSQEADSDVFGCDAACWSGMVPDHAMAWARVADSANVIILNRPVNPDATPLIYENASTKGMNLKGKSSDWGPQKGLIPVNQRFSKLWSLYSEPELSTIVKKFNEKVESLFSSGSNEVFKRQLEKSYSCPELNASRNFKAWITPEGSDATAEIRFSAVDNSDIIYEWSADKKDNDCPLMPCVNYCNSSELDTFFVLANPDSAIAANNNGIAPVYTADYDLLAMGFFDAALFNNPNYAYERPSYIPPEVFFDCDKGIMFPNQVELLDVLNRSVKELGYKGGNVAHHGPENQFTNMVFTNFECGSKKDLKVTANPYFDYPITAFEPDNVRGQSAGVVRSIQMGPPGYKDINLKRYIAEKRRQGFNIIANPDSPSWQWEYWRPYTYEQGFDDRDYPDLPSYPEELPRPNTQECINLYGCLDQRPTQKVFDQITTFEKPRIRASEKYKIYPNPVGHRPFSLTMLSKGEQTTEVLIIDVFGRIVHRHKVRLHTGFNELWMDTQNLISGQYYLSFQLGSEHITTSLNVQK